MVAYKFHFIPIYQFTGPNLHKDTLKPSHDYYLYVKINVDFKLFLMHIFKKGGAGCGRQT